MLAGPQWAKYMMQAAGHYPAAHFAPPPKTMTKASGRSRTPSR